MKTEFINTISSGKFFSAKQLLQTIPSGAIANFLINITFETNLIGIYTFVVFLLLENESIFFHEIAIEILSVSMWKGANAAAFLHAKQIVKLAPANIKRKQHLLTYFGIPDCIMPYEEALFIAKEILKKDPTNITALETITQISDKTK